jgi:hypothetical protein
MYAVVPQIIKDEQEKNALLTRQISQHQSTISLLNKKIEAIEKDKHTWMQKALRVDFDARVSKGCYTNCPMGKLT